MRTIQETHKNPLVEEYFKNGKEIIRINKETALKIQEIQKEKEAKLGDIWNRQRVLEEEERATRTTYEQAVNVAHDEEKKQAEPYNNQRDAVRRIINFLEVAERYKPIKMEDGEVRVEEGKFLEWLEWIYNDDYLKIRFLIGENDKPVNKYSVMVYGMCAFGEPLIELPHNYHRSLRDSYFSIAQEIGSFKTIEEAKACIAKKIKQGIFKDTIKEAEALKKEYLEVTATWKLSDFEKLFEYRCSDCHGRFKQKPVTHNRSDGTKCECHYGLYREVIR